MNTYNPDSHGRFGDFGGKFVPETLMNAISELEQAFKNAMEDDSFIKEYKQQLRSYSGRPTALTFAQTLQTILIVQEFT